MGDESSTERERLGDRVERAIELRTDAEAEIAIGEAEPKSSLRRTAFWLAVTGISLYLVAPSLLDVLGSWRSLSEVSPLWLPLMLLLTVASLASLWWLQRIVLRQARLRDVIDSQLAGNALAKVAPGGGAMGAALQYKMLVEVGVERGPAVTALTAVNLLTFVVVLALPVLAIPALFTGGVDGSLVEATIISLIVFVVLLGVGALLLVVDGPLRSIGRLIQRIRNRLRRHSEPLTGLPDRLMRERDRLLAAIGPKWKEALLAIVGRWAFDYAILLASLAAVGSHPRPALILLAFCTAQVLAQIPVTPGGLGFVEAGMAATLALAGVPAGDAVLATFIYRLFTYWLPMPAGLVGYALHRRRVQEVAVDRGAA
jgi:uncharacterized protein (TIRG00374 family)